MSLFKDYYTHAPISFFPGSPLRIIGTWNFFGIFIDDIYFTNKRQINWSFPLATSTSSCCFGKYALKGNWLKAFQRILFKVNACIVGNIG